MQNVAIYPIPGGDGTPLFRAVTRLGQTEGRTAGEALDALSGKLPSDASGTMVLIQPFRPDAFFTAAQLSRLEYLMNGWRAARDGQGPPLTADEQIELQSLVDAELRAASDRAAQLLREWRG
jgi:hypothetical protein